MRLIRARQSEENGKWQKLQRSGIEFATVQAALDMYNAAQAAKVDDMNAYMNGDMVDLDATEATV